MSYGIGRNLHTSLELKNLFDRSKSICISDSKPANYIVYLPTHTESISLVYPFPFEQQCAFKYKGSIQLEGLILYLAVVHELDASKNYIVGLNMYKKRVFLRMYRFNIK